MAESHFSLGNLINWIVCVVFLLFAFVQLNDPDPYVWVAIYGLIAIFFAVVTICIIISGYVFNLIL